MAGFDNVLYQIGYQQFLFTCFHYIVSFVNEILCVVIFDNEIKKNYTLNRYVRPLLMALIYFLISFLLYYKYVTG